MRRQSNSLQKMLKSTVSLPKQTPRLVQTKTSLLISVKVAVTIKIYSNVKNANEPNGAQLLIQLNQVESCLLETKQVPKLKKLDVLLKTQLHRYRKSRMPVQRE